MAKNGPFIGVNAFLLEAENSSLIEVAKSLQYSDANICVLEGNAEILQRDHPNTYNAILTCRHNRDSRTPIEYAQDLVASWVFEDYFVFKMNSIKAKYGFEVILAGADKGREILTNKNVSAKSDCAFLYNGNRLPLEIMSDYTGYWSRTKKLDLRDSKYKSLVDESSVLIGISTIDTKFLILDCTDSNNKNVKYIPYHYAYHKPAYQVDLNNPDTRLIDFDIHEISKKLIAVLGKPSL